MIPFHVLFVITLQDDGSCHFPVLGSPNFFLYGGELLLIGAGGKDIAALFGQLCENGCDLYWSLTLAQNDFGHSVPQGAMVVDLGESEVFKRQMAQARYGVVGSEFATATSSNSLRMESAFTMIAFVSFEQCLE